ncbi:MAG: hypothetical protein IJ343_06015 [Clostridia bacterium]|nr:hypothetical protein [Clostridia bacterium]
MAMLLTCRLERNVSGVLIRLPASAVERAYVLLDALKNGDLHSFAFQMGSDMLQCSMGDRDRLAGDMLMLSEGSVDAVKHMLFGIVQCPHDAAWLHQDVEAEGGDVTIHFELNM